MEIYFALNKGIPKMKKILKFVLFLILVIMWSEQVVAADNVDIYKLHQGDTVSISVWHQDALQKKLVILPDGSITFPLIGRIEVVNLSAPQVEQLITEKLKKYMVDEE